jgi:hypothetical protein
MSNDFDFSISAAEAPKEIKRARGRTNKAFIV